jgi:hypothetical protein
MVDSQEHLPIFIGEFIIRRLKVLQKSEPLEAPFAVHLPRNYFA